MKGRKIHYEKIHKACVCLSQSQITALFEYFFHQKLPRSRTQIHELFSLLKIYFIQCSATQPVLEKFLRWRKKVTKISVKIKLSFKWYFFFTSTAIPPLLETRVVEKDQKYHPSRVKMLLHEKYQACFNTIKAACVVKATLIILLAKDRRNNYKICELLKKAFKNRLWSRSYFLFFNRSKISLL